MTFLKHKTSILLLLLYCFYWNPCSAQINNNYFTDVNKIVVLDSTQKTQLDIEVFSFLKNNEYFSPLLNGFTLFGQQIMPTLSYYPSKHLIIKVGGLVLQDFGNEKFTQIKPILSMIYHKKGTKLLFGNLEGNLKHQLIEPMYNLEKLLTNPLEYGIQLKTTSKRFKTDTWIDWQKAIYERSNFQEEIWGGCVLDLNILENDKLELISQFTAKHRGGQINTGNLPIQTTINFAFGFKSSLYQNANNTLKRISSSYFYTHFASDNPAWAKQNNGQGFLGSITFETKWIDLAMNYWRANQHIAPMGGDLYQTISVNYFQPNVIDLDREILILRLMKELSLDKDLKLLVRIEPFYDFKSAALEHSESIYLKYNFAWRKKQKTQ